MSSTTNATVVRRSNGKTASTPAVVLPLAETVPGKVDPLVEARLLAGYASDIADNLATDSTTAHARAKLVYTARDLESVPLAKLSTLLGRELARRAHPDATDGELDSLALVYSYSKSLLSRSADSWAYPVAAGIINPTVETVSLVGKLLNNSKGASGLLKAIVGAGVADESAYIAEVRGALLVTAGERATAREVAAADRAAAAIESADAVDVGDAVESVPASSEVLVQAAVAALAALATLTLSDSELESVRTAVDSFESAYIVA